MNVVYRWNNDSADYFLKDKPEKVEDIFWGIAKFVKE